MCKIFDEIREEGILKGIEQGREEGIVKGLEQGRTEAATAMIKGGQIPIELISKYSGLTIQEVEALARTINQ